MTIQVQSLGMVARPKAPSLLLTWPMTLVLLHFPLGAVMDRFPAVATLHAYSVFLLAITLAAKRKTREKAIYLLCYIGCCDVLWRMNGASFPWEGGKYAMIVVALILWSHDKALTSTSRIGILMSALLLPSCILTLNYFGFNEEARQAISFNISGIAAITGVFLIFSTVKSNQISIDSILKATLAPIIAIYGVTLVATVGATSIRFDNAANFATSGGYGPNQVSSLLGLGALICLILIMRIDGVMMRALWCGLMAALILQSLLTFSRGGIYNLALCFVVLGAHYFTSGRARVAFIAMIAVIASTAWFALPILNDFTGGGFARRFSSSNSSGRADIGFSEFEIWREHPIFGVGPGLAQATRVSHRGVASHTEFTRLLSEHGLLGLAIIGLLLVVITSSYARAPSLMTKAWIATFSVWSLASMMHTGMRFSAAVLVLGFITFDWRRFQPSRSPSR